MNSSKNLSLSKYSRKSSLETSLLSPNVKRLSSINVVLKTPHNFAERYGLLTPAVIEELFMSTDGKCMTGNISEYGYAWIVHGRKLYTWKYKSMRSPAQQNLEYSTTHELQLPHSDLSNRAELVTVFFTADTDYPSCIAVTPAGVVRYWPDISQKFTSVDQRINLNGQECACLGYVKNVGCVFVTTTCTVGLVQLTNEYNTPNMIIRILKTPSNWFSSLGKLSTLFWDPVGDQGSETNAIVRLLVVPTVSSDNQDIYNIYVLACLNFQKWILTADEPEKMLWTVDLTKLIKNAFRENIAHWQVSDYNDINIWVLDIQRDQTGVLILCATVNLHQASHVYYAIVSIDTNNLEAPVQARDFLLLKIIEPYDEKNQKDVINYRFILCENNAYIYNNKIVAVIRPQEEPDILRFSHPREYIFCGITCFNLPLFLSRRSAVFGIYSMSANMAVPSMETLGISLNNPAFSGNENLSVYYMDPYEIIKVDQNLMSQLRAAFIFHVKNKLPECFEIITKYFSNDLQTNSNMEVNNSLDVLVVKISEDILNDVPAGDPRWAKSDKKHGFGSSHSMLVLNQLVDKQKAYALFLKFLKESGLWVKLYVIDMNGKKIATAHLINTFFEKLTAAIVLKSLPCSKIIQDTIDKAVTNYETPANTAHATLTTQDIFFKEVNRINEGISCITDVCKQITSESMESIEVADSLHEANKTILVILKEIIQYREQHKEILTLSNAVKSLNLEYSPWTTASGPNGLGDALIQQLNLTLNYALKIVTLGSLEKLIVDDYVQLTDYLLDGKKCHLATVQPGEREKMLYKRFCSLRTELIEPLVQLMHLTEATMLAEKYVDFEILLTIGGKLDTGEERVDEYMKRFKDTDFANLAYNWYLKNDKQAALLKRYYKYKGQLPEGSEKFINFMSNHPKLQWIQQIYDSKFLLAADTVYNLGCKETESIGRQKTMFSISKLALLADNDSASHESYLNMMNKKLELIEHQNSIPKYVLMQYGYDITYTCVLSPKDIIALLISSEYVDSTVTDFKRAFLVIGFVEEEFEIEDIILSIWRAALLKDSWNFVNVDSPLECLEKTFFYQLIKVMSEADVSLDRVLPPIEDLIDHSSLNELMDNAVFKYLLKVCYEHFFNKV